MLNEYHEKLIESVAEHDEDLMEKYFDGEEISIDEIKKSYPKSYNRQYNGSCYLRFFISETRAFRCSLDAIIDYMPAPTDVPAIKGINPETGEEDEQTFF